MIELPESIIRFGSGVTHTEPEFNEGDVKIQGSFNVVVNSENNAPGGSVDNVSFIAFRPGHVVTFDLSGDLQHNINLQFMALPFTEESDLGTIYSQSLTSGTPQIFADYFVLKAVVASDAVALELSGITVRETPGLIVPLGEMPRTLSFGIDAEQNFVVNVGDLEVLKHRVSDNLIVAADDRIVVSVSGYHNEAIVAPPFEVTYEVGTQGLFEDHYYAVDPDGVYHFGQIESFAPNNDYFLEVNDFYLRKGIVDSNNSIIDIPLDGQTLQIYIPVVNLTGSVSIFLFGSPIRMNRGFISNTNYLILANLGEDTVAAAFNEGSSPYEWYGVTGITMLSGVEEDLFRIQWFFTTDDGGLNYGHSFELPIAELPPDFNFLWQINVGNLADPSALSDVSANVQITRPLTYVPASLELGGPDGGDPGEEDPDFSQDFITDGGTFSVMETDIYWGQIESMQWMDPIGFEPWQFAKLVLNANSLHESPYSLSYAIAPNTLAGSEMYFVLPLNGQEGYITTGSGTDVAGFDPETVSALIEIQVYLDGDQKSVQFSHIAGSYVSEPSVSFPIIDDNSYFEFQARIDPLNASVQLLLGAPGNATEFGPQMFAISGSLQRISLILKTQDLAVIGRYGSSDAFLSDIDQVTLFNGVTSVDLSDPPITSYVMTPASIEHYDPDYGETTITPISMIHRIVPDVGLINAQVALAQGTGTVLGFHPSQPCVVRFTLSMVANVNDTFALNVQQVRMGALEVVVTYGTNGQIIEPITYRRIDSDGLTYVFDLAIPHVPDPGYEEGWVIGITTGSIASPSTNCAGVVIFNRADVSKVTLDSTRDIGTNGVNGEEFVLPIENHPLFMSYTVIPVDGTTSVTVREVFTPIGLPVLPV